MKDCMMAYFISFSRYGVQAWAAWKHSQQNDHCSSVFLGNIKLLSSQNRYFFRLFRGTEKPCLLSKTTSETEADSSADDGTMVWLKVNKSRPKTGPRRKWLSCYLSEPLQAGYDAVGGNAPEQKAAVCHGFYTPDQSMFPSLHLQ